MQKVQIMDILIDKNNHNYIKDTNPYEKFDKIDNDVMSFYMKQNIQLISTMVKK